MKCEICDIQTATMWVDGWARKNFLVVPGRKPVLSCDDCGPQLGYKTLAPLTSVQCHG